MSLLSILLALTSLGWPAQSAAMNCPVGGSAGDYSKNAIELCFQDFAAGQRHLNIPSPDGSARFVVDGDMGQFYARGRAVGPPWDIANVEELIWSPDSRAVIATVSFGAAGPTSADFGYIDDQKSNLPEPAVTPMIQRSFAARHPRLECGDNINVGGLGWVDDAKEALFVAEIPAIPDCGHDWGYFDVYVISFPEGKIVRIYPMAEALTRFKRLLGQGLRLDVPHLVKEEHHAPAK